MKRIILIFALIALFTFDLPAVTGGISWQIAASMPSPRRNLSLVSLNGKVYALGGYGQPNKGASNTVFCYNANEDKWEQKKQMYYEKSNGVAVRVDDKIYSLGGDPYFAAVEVYDPNTNTWSKCKNMTTGRMLLTCSAVNGKIYAITGCLNDYQTATPVNEMYDPATNQWSTKSPIPTPRTMASASVVNGKIYVIGGMNELGSVLKVVEVYDPITDTWDTRTPLTFGRFGHGAAVVNNKIYIIGGNDEGITAVQIYDTESDTWFEGESIHTGRKFCGSCNCENHIMVAGGCDADFYATSSTEICTIESSDIEEIINEFEFKNMNAYINNNELSIEFLAENSDFCNIKIYNLQGNECFNFEGLQYSQGINLIRKNVNIPKGVYICNIITKNGILSKKFINN